MSDAGRAATPALARRHESIAKVLPAPPRLYPPSPRIATQE